MKIKDEIYNSLTVRQRVIASVEALARGDEAERKRLVKSCRKLTVKQTDPAYSEKMEALTSLPVAIECDLRGYALDYLTALWCEAEFDKPMPEKMFAALQAISDIRAAWLDILKEEGIRPEAMASAFSGLSHSVLRSVEKSLPVADPAAVEGVKAMMRAAMATQCA